MKKIIFISLFTISFFPIIKSQNIGISNDASFTTPQSPLHIYWTSDGNLLQLSRSSSSNTGLTFSVNSDDYSILNRQNNALIFGTNALERMRILSSGNVLINATTPIFTTDLFETIGNSTFPDPISSYTSDASSTAAIYGESTTSDGTGVWGSATVGTQAFGLHGTTTDGYGVVGSSTNNFGGYFQSNYSTASAKNVWALDAYMNNSLSNDGNGYAFTSSNSGGLRAVTWNSPTYSYGVAGFSYNDDTRCGGVLGAEYDGSPWGALGYENSGGSKYGVYGSSAYASGGGKNNSIINGIGVAGFGSLLGGTFRGELYGMITKGSRYSLYVDGNQFINSYIAQLSSIPNTSKRIVSFVPTSTTVDIIDKGIGLIIDGKATIQFKKEFTNLVSESEPIIITVTPIGQNASLFIKNYSKDGFSVKNAIYDSTKINNIKFSWIAIGVKKGYEQINFLPNEILSNDFDYHLSKFLFDDSNTSSKGENMWWDGQQLRFENIPEDNIQKNNNNQVSKKLFLQKKQFYKDSNKKTK